MTTAIRPTAAAVPSRPILRSVGAIVAALLANVLLSAAVDQVLHVIGVFPPWGQVTYEPLPVFGILSGYIVARLAPRAPMRHAGILGVIGIVLSTAGAIASIVGNLGPAWYAIALVAVALPTARLGARL